MSVPVTLTRRGMLASMASFAALGLSGCAGTLGTRRFDLGEVMPAEISPYYREIYGEVADNGFVVPAVDLKRVPDAFLRAEVADPTGERPGTIVVVTSERYLYLVREDGRALRYGVGIGREGFTWSGRGVIGRKATWPTWTPPREMQQRQPETRQYAGGMPGGLENPLGARALYIYRDGADTLYRLHGTAEFWSIGQAVSSGCVRLINQDVMDLYGRVPSGTPILVVA